MKRWNLKRLSFAWKGSASRVWALFRNEIEALLKDKQSLLIIFLLPIIIMIPFWEPPAGESEGEGDGGGMFSDFSLGGGSGINVYGVLDLDTTTDWPGEDLSENFTGIFKGFANMTILNVTDYKDGLDKLKNREIAGFLVIPDGFERNITNRAIAEVLIVNDATDVEAVGTITAVLEITFIAFKLYHGLFRDEIYPVPYSKFEANSPLFKSGPLIFSILIFGSGVLLASQAIVGDEPLRRTLLTPAGKLEVVIAKTMAYSAIHAVQVQALLFVAMIFFYLPVYGEYYISFTVLFLVAFCGAMIGMFISTISKTRLQANQMFLLVFILCLLALIFIPNPQVNDWMPMYQGVNGFVSAAFKGFDFSLKPWPVFSLGILSAAFFVLTNVAFYFKKTVE